MYRSFAAVARGRMTFLISHRIGSARLADRILVLAGGRIAEQGTHAALVGADGRYARFFEAQARWYRGDDPAGPAETAARARVAEDGADA